MAIEMFIVNTDVEIESCFLAFKALCPHIEQHDYLRQVRRQHAKYALFDMKGSEHEATAGCLHARR
ncbi:MAG: hypothetical protein ACYDCF_01455 [Burkholderiales bacterium]